MKTGIIVFAHGSSVTSANQVVEDAVGEVAREGGFALATAAFLEIATPDLPQAFAAQAAAGAERIVVVPYFLTPGIHLKRDLPRILGELQQQFPTVQIDVTPPLDGHPALRRIILDRVQKALAC